MRELNVDWASLHSAFQMNMPEVKCFLCVEDGRVLKLPPGDPALSIVRIESHRYLPIEAVPSRIQYQWLDDFIKSVDVSDARTRMEAAINGKGAFRRFKDILLTLPDERRRWFEFRDQMMRKRIIEWVREQGILALNEPTWLSSDAFDEDGHLPPPEGEIIGSAGIIPSTSYGSAVQYHRPATLTAGATTSAFVTSVPGSVAMTANFLNGSSVINTTKQVDIEALRDYLIEWTDQRASTTSPSPIELETLAEKIAKRFRLSAL